jgi:adhesin/invasin
MTWNLSANGVFSYTVAAVTGSPLPSGITAGTNTITPAGTDTITTVTFTTTSPTPGQAFTVTWAFDDNVTRVATFTYEAPQVGSSRGDVVLTNTESSKKLVAGGTGSAEATVTDQFGGLVSGATVIWTVTGRNAVTATTATTNSTGKSTFSWTDSNATVGTTNITDTVKAEVTFGNSASYDSAQTSFTIVSSLTAGTLTVQSGDADGEITADDGSVTFTVTVRDSSSAALSGFPVTVSGFTNTYTTGTGTVYTGANGTVTFTANGKTVGAETLTFTSGGKSATGTVDVVAGASRTYSVDKTTVAMAPGEEPVVTVTVLDQYGNVVEDQAVTITYAGTGGVTRINGIQASSGTTDANGKVAITLGSTAAGTGTLTVKSTMANTSTAATRGDGTAMPARTASTGFTTAVTISGSSAAVTAAEAASDAAAEAIDAANAATDAANLAAEAADAATVAAEEARDAADAATAAVEELATQVATLMAALKAQITTLANTVAKIAKKVRA